MSTRKPKYSMTGLLLTGIILIVLGCCFLIMGCTYFAVVLNPPVDCLEDACIFCAGGAILLIVGVFGLLLEYQKRMRIKELYAAGDYVMAQITDIGINYFLTVIKNCPHPYIVTCRYRDAQGEEHLFKSRNLYFDPRPFLQERTVKVYVKSMDFKYYYVDIDEVIHKPAYY